MNPLMSSSFEEKTNSMEASPALTHARRKMKSVSVSVVHTQGTPLLKNTTSPTSTQSNTAVGSPVKSTSAPVAPLHVITTPTKDSSSLHSATLQSMSSPVIREIRSPSQVEDPLNGRVDDSNFVRRSTRKRTPVATTPQSTHIHLSSTDIHPTQTLPLLDNMSNSKRGRKRRSTGEYSARSSLDFDVGPRRRQGELLQEDVNRLLMRASFPAIGDIRLQLVHDTTKGHGVSTRSYIAPGAFVLEYAGELLTREEALKREEVYGDKLGCYMFYFRFKRKQFCVDATLPGFNWTPSHTVPSVQLHDSCLGFGWARLMNHSRSPCLLPKVLDCPPPPLCKEEVTEEAAMEKQRKIAEALNKASKPSLTLSSTLITSSTPSNPPSSSSSSSSSSSPTSSSSTSTSASSSSTPPVSSLGGLSVKSVKTPYLYASQAAIAQLPAGSYPRIIFFSSREIFPDEELTFDYGDRDPQSLVHFPWLGQS